MYAVAGAGLTGAVLAHLIATKLNQRVDIFESRNHVGGNLFTYRDSSTGIMVHKYGPHILHSPKARLFDWFKRYLSVMPYEHHVYGEREEGLRLPIPINLETLSILAEQTLSPALAKAWIDEQRAPFRHLQEDNFEHSLLKRVGRVVYEKVFKDYTEKQWGRPASEIPATVAGRLPLRFNLRRSYHHSNFVGMPKNGYGPLFEKLLDHPKIAVFVNSPMTQADGKHYKHQFFTGPIDAFFQHSEGHLGYRSLYWEDETHVGDFQGAPQVNLLHKRTPATRIIEHKHFEYWTDFEHTIISREVPIEHDQNHEPLYPIRTESDKAVLSKYHALLDNTKNVSVLGRLGAYEYLDMWLAVQRVQEFFGSFMVTGKWQALG